MKRLLLLLCGLVALHSGVAADWREQLTSPEPGTFPPLRPLKATYGFGWGAIKAARAEFEFSKPTPSQNRLAVSAKSVGAVRALWRLDTQHVALCRADNLQPMQFRQTEVYSDETLTTAVEFSPDVVSRVRTSSKKDPNEGKTKRFEMPNVFDLHSALLFVRSQPLRPGDSYRIVVYPSTNPFLAQLDVLGPRKVKVAGSTREAIQLDLKLRRINKKKELEPHQKFKRASAWISNDSDRLVLKIQADIFVGSVWTELEKVEFVGR
jgi:hypothetical protein